MWPGLPHAAHTQVCVLSLWLLGLLKRGCTYFMSRLMTERTGKWKKDWSWIIIGTNESMCNSWQCCRGCPLLPKLLLGSGLRCKTSMVNNVRVHVGKTQTTVSSMRPFYYQSGWDAETGTWWIRGNLRLAHIIFVAVSCNLYEYCALYTLRFAKWEAACHYPYYHSDALPPFPHATTFRKIIFSCKWITSL